MAPLVLGELLLGRVGIETPRYPFYPLLAASPHSWQEPGIEPPQAASLPLVQCNVRPSEGRFMCLFPVLQGERTIWPCANLSSEYT